MSFSPLPSRRSAIGGAVLLAMMAQAAGAQEPAQDDNWFASQLRRYRSYPHLHQAFRLVQENRYDEANRQLEQTLAIDPANREARLAYVDVLTRQRRCPKAVEQANAYLARWPRDTHARVIRAYVLECAGLRAQAVRDYDTVYRSAAATPADRTLAATAVAEWALSHGQPRRALPALEVALRFSDAPSLHLRAARAHVALGHAPEAERAYQKALSGAARPGERVAALLGLANLALGQQDTARALPYLRQASALAPRDWQIARQLVHAYFALGSYDDAARAAQVLLMGSEAPEDAYLLGIVHTARHAVPDAAAAYTQASQSTDPILRGKALLALGYSAQAGGERAAAQQAFAQAAALPGGVAAARELKAMQPPPSPKRAAAPVPTVQARAQSFAEEAYAALAAHQHARARSLFEKALALEERDLWRTQLVEVVRQQGDLAQARALLKTVAQPDLRQLRELADLSLELGDADAGLEYLGRAARQSNSAQDYLRLARASWQIGQNTLALQAYRVTQVKMLELAPADQDALLAELGYAYLRNGQDALAIEALDAAYQRAPRFELALELASLEQRTGAPDAARARLDRIDATGLEPTQKQTWYATRADLARQAGGTAASVALLREAVQVAPNASLHYQLGMDALAIGDRTLAREQLLRVRQLDPDNWSAALQLGYVCHALHDLPCAIDAFEQVAQLHPDVDGLAEGLAYAYTEQGNNDRAVHWFKRAIDRIDAQAAPQATRTARAAPTGAAAPARAPSAYQSTGYRPGGPLPLRQTGWTTALPQQQQQDVPAPPQDAAGAGADPQEPGAIPSDPQLEKREALRQQIGSMTRSWQLNGYQSVRNASGQQGAGRAVGSGALFSQGGLELQVPIPGLGYQDGRILQVESRVLWSNHPETLAIDSKTVQGTLGLAYKPFKEQDGYLRFERLIKIGDQSQSNWLLHASWGTADGWGWNPVKPHWNYTTFYADAGVMLQRERTRSLYMEGRQGRSFAVAERMVLTPHLLLAGRVQRPDPTRVSYIEGGAGLSLKTSFNGSRYVAERSSLELSLQYRKPIARQAGGWALSLAAQL